LGVLLTFRGWQVNQAFFDNRMILHKDYFENITEIKNAYTFARTVLNHYSKK
jgi:hypothetical protein